MKNCLIVFFALFIVSTVLPSCSQSYLSHEEIVSSMTDTKSASLQKSSMSDEEMRRRSNLIPLKDLFGDKLDELEKKKKDKNIKANNLTEEKERKGADLRGRDTPIKSQWNGTCTTFAGVGAIENILNRPSTLDLSERDSWSKYGKYSCSAFVSALSKEGNEICREQDWSQNSTVPKSSCSSNRNWRLGETKYIGDNISAALDALDRGSVVYIGMQTPEDMLSCRSVIRTNTSFSNGGHALSIVGYQMDSRIEGGGYFIIKNSWGSRCGDQGYQYVPFHICNRSDGYCIMWEFKTVIEKSGGNPDNTDDEYKWVYSCKRLWYTLWIVKKCDWIKVKV